MLLITHDLSVHATSKDPHLAAHRWPFVLIALATGAGDVRIGVRAADCERDDVIHLRRRCDPLATKTRRCLYSAQVTAPSITIKHDDWINGFISHGTLTGTPMRLCDSVPLPDEAFMRTELAVLVAMLWHEFL